MAALEGVDYRRDARKIPGMGAEPRGGRCLDVPLKTIRRNIPADVSADIFRKGEVTTSR